MKHLTLSHDRHSKGADLGRVYCSHIIGPAEALGRSPALRDLLPPEGRRYIKQQSGWPCRVIVLSSRLKDGGVRMTFFRGAYRPDIDQDELDATLHQAMVDARGMPGRPANWPFPTWGGQA